MKTRAHSLGLLFGAILLVAAPAAYSQPKPGGKKPGKTNEAPKPKSEAGGKKQEEDSDKAASGGNVPTKGPAADLENGLRLYDQKNYFEAAKLLYKVSSDESGEAAPFKQKAEFFLAKSLFNLDY